jgi:hypothetical protein
MKKHFMLILILAACFVSILATQTFAMNITIGGQFGIANPESFKNYWAEQSFSSIPTDMGGFTYYFFPKSARYKLDGKPQMFYGPILGFQITPQWGVTLKGIFNQYEAETERVTDTMTGNYGSGKVKGNLYNTDIKAHYFFNKFINIFFGLSFNFFEDEKELTIFNTGAARTFSLKYDHEILESGPMLGVGIIAYMVKGFYFAFNADFEYYFGTSVIDFTSQNDEFGFKYPESNIFKKDSINIMVAGNNTSIVFGYNFFSAGVDIALGLTGQYLFYMYNEKRENSFESYDSKDNFTWALTLSATYTFSIGNKIKPGEEYKYQDPNSIWVPLPKGKSTNL